MASLLLIQILLGSFDQALNFLFENYFAMIKTRIPQFDKVTKWRAYHSTLIMYTYVFNMMFKNQ